MGVPLPTQDRAGEEVWTLPRKFCNFIPRNATVRRTFTLHFGALSLSGFALGPRVAIVEVGDVCVTIRL